MAQFLGLFNKDGCGGFLKLRYPERIVRRLMLHSVFIDVGLSTAKNNEEVNVFDYMNYISMASKEYPNAGIYYVVPDSHDVRQHFGYATALLDIAIHRKVKPSGIPILVLHYYQDFKTIYKLFLMRFKDVFNKVIVGIPARILTASWRGGNPLKIQCRVKADACIRYIEHVMTELFNAGFRDFHILGINRKEYRWLINSLERSDGVSRLDINVTADTDNYRLAANNKLRVRDYGKGKYMISNESEACKWFEEWIKVRP